MCNQNALYDRINASVTVHLHGWPRRSHMWAYVRLDPSHMWVYLMKCGHTWVTCGHTRWRVITCDSLVSHMWTYLTSIRHMWWRVSHMWGRVCHMCMTSHHMWLHVNTCGHMLITCGHMLITCGHMWSHVTDMCFFHKGLAKLGIDPRHLGFVHHSLDHYNTVTMAEQPHFFHST